MKDSTCAAPCIYPLLRLKHTCIHTRPLTHPLARSCMHLLQKFWVEPRQPTLVGLLDVIHSFCLLLLLCCFASFPSAFLFLSRSMWCAGRKAQTSRPTAYIPVSSSQDCGSTLQSSNPSSSLQASSSPKTLHRSLFLFFTCTHTWTDANSHMPLSSC